VSIKHIAFDLDGTLVDTRDQIVESILTCLPEAARNKQTREAIKLRAHRSPKTILADFGVGSLERYWKSHAALAIHSKAFFDDTRSVFKQLAHRGTTLSVVTSLPARPANTLIDVLGIGNYLTLIDTYASRRYRKPSPKLLAVHLDDCKVESAEAAYVGDTAGDMQMASAAGVHAWATGWSTTSAAELTNAGAERILRSLREIIRLAS
jgi:phosphoglycolate phosphatase